MRILGSYVVLLAFAAMTSFLIARQVLFSRLDQRLDDELVQESLELRKLSGGTDPQTGLPFGVDVRRIYEVFLQRNVPSKNEAFITFVDGKPFLRSRPVVPYRLDRDKGLVERWSSVSETDRGRVGTPAGAVEFLAVPLLADGEGRGVFVAAIFRDRELAAVESDVRAMGVVGLVVLLVGSVLAWRVADHVLVPMRRVTATAHAISETDLSRRIPLSGQDEVSQLAATFNDMLDRLETAFQTLRTFADDAGHELRTPITIIRGHLEVLGDDPDDRRETIAIVLDELDRMNRITTDLLLLSKARQPNFLELDEVELGSLTREIFDKAQVLAPRAWQLDGIGDRSVLIDRQRMTQAVMQLAQNAVQHTSRGDIITLGSKVAGSEARMWVRDTGAGVPAKDQTQIFERFSRGEGDPRSDGAGLGLAIVKAIAEAHRGRVELESKPGVGATFTVVLPLILRRPELFAQR